MSNGQPINALFHSQIPIQNYVEFPKDLSFSIIDKLAKDCSHSGINLITSNNTLKDLYQERWEELDMKNHIYYLMLRFFYGGQSAACFITDQSEDIHSPIDYSSLKRLYKINSLSYLTLTTPIWFFRKPSVKSPFSFIYDEPFLQVGGDFPHISHYYGLYENKQPLYFTIKQVGDVIEKITNGLDVTGERFATLLKKDSKSNDMNVQLNKVVQEQFMSAVDFMNNRSGVIIGDNEEMTNLGMNLNGVDKALESLFYIISILTGIPQNVLLGKGQGVASSAQEDFRQYNLIINGFTERYVRPFINRVNYLLFHSQEDLLFDFRGESISFEFNPIKPQSEEEASRSTAQNIQNMINLKTLGFTNEEVVSLDTTVSSLKDSIKKEERNENS